MPVHYFKCLACEQMFVYGKEELPSGLNCVVGKCEVRTITLEEAERYTEEMRDKKDE